MSGNDVAAILGAANKDGNSFFGEGLWGVILLLIVAGVISGNGFFGNGNSTGVTEEYIANQFNSRDVWSTNQNVSNTASATQMEVLNNRANCNNNYSNLRYDNAVGQANIDKDVLIGNQTLQAQIAQNALQAQANLDSCCCTLRTEMQQGIQSVKDLINNNTIQDLRDQLNISTTANANAVQTNTILSNLGKFYMNMPINPYYAYGYGYNGTTIA